MAGDEKSVPAATVEWHSEKLHDAILTFIDFIYAAVFTLLVQDTYEKVITSTDRLRDKFIYSAMIMAVFYLLAWDWLLGRILTLRIPYQSYGRFLFEVAIAVLAFGAGRSVVRRESIFLLYIASLLIAGAIWSRQTSRYPERLEARDRRELCVICWVHTIGAVLAIGTYLYLWSRSLLTVGPQTAALTVPAIWIFILCYEILVPRSRGLTGGPGAPFVSRADLRKIRRWLLLLSTGDEGEDVL